MISADLTLALRHERAAMAIEGEYARCHASLHPDLDVDVRAIADGAAVFAGVGSPMSQATGIGLDGPVNDSDLDELEAFYHRRGSAARLVVCPLADATLISALGDRGFVVAEFEQVMVRDLRSIPEAASSLELEISRATPDDLDVYMDTVGPNFTPDGVVSPEMRQMMKAVFLMNNSNIFLARLGGVHAGGGSLLVHNGVAMLAGAATLPEHRKRGVQAALFQARLAHALELGCDLAVMGAMPGSGSQRNAERKGFQVAYTKAVLVRPAISAS